MPRNHIHINKI